MKASKSKVVALLLAGLMSASLVSCGSGGGGGNTSDGNAEEQTTFTMWEIQTEENFRNIFADSVSRFEEANPGYKLEDIVYANEDYKQKIAIALGSNTAPDIFVTWTGGGMQEYIDAGRITPLTEYMEKDNYKDYFMDAGVNMATVDGEIWAVPVENCSIAAIFYNKAMFEEHNITVPTTLEELESVCDTFLSEGISPFALPNKTKYFASMYYMYLVDRMAGPELFANAAAGEDNAFFDDTFTWAAEKMQDWAKKGYFSEGYNSLDGETGMHRTMFYNGEVAMILDGSWVVSSFVTENEEFIDNIGIFPFPTVEGGKGDPNSLVGTIGDTFYCINSECKNPEMAFEAIKYLIDETAVQKRIDAGRLPPTKNATAGNPLNEEILKLVSQAPSIQLWYDQYLPSEAAEVHKDSMQALVGLSITPEEYNQAMQDAVDAATK